MLPTTFYKNPKNPLRYAANQQNMLSSPVIEKSLDHPNWCMRLFVDSIGIHIQDVFSSRGCVSSVCIMIISADEHIPCTFDYGGTYIYTHSMTVIMVYYMSHTFHTHTWF